MKNENVSKLSVLVVYLVWFILNWSSNLELKYLIAPVIALIITLALVHAAYWVHRKYVEQKYYSFKNWRHLPPTELTKYNVRKDKSHE